MIYCFDLLTILYFACDTHKDEIHGKWMKTIEATPYPERIKVVNKLWEDLNILLYFL